MEESLKYVVFNTEMGWVSILSSGKGLVRTTLPQTSIGEALNMLGEPISRAEHSPDYFGELQERLQCYFSGHRISFPDELDLSGTTPFQRLVWETTKLIPYGETRSYGWVAAYLRKPGAVRAVGQALSRNPLPIIIPCHRVIQSNGGLGGFTGGGGLETKIKLLALET